MANSSSNNGSPELFFGNTAPITTDHEDNASFLVTDDGTPTGNPLEFWKFDAETLTWVLVPTGGDTCPAPMTRAALLALRNAGSLNPQCHYIITNPEANGTLTAQSIILHAVDATTLSMQAGIKTSYDNTAWQGVYDIDTNDVLEVTDNLENKVISNASIITFPFGVASVNSNTVMNRANVVYNGGNFINNVVDTDANVTTSGNTNRNHFEAASNTTVNSGDFLENRVEGDATVVSSTTLDVDNNIFRANSSSTINSGNFDNNEVHSDANVLIDGGVAITNNHFYSASNTTINSGDFRNNQVQNDATVTSSTTGDVDNNTFGHLSNTTVSGGANVDTNVIDTDATLVISGGILTRSHVGQQASVTLIGQSNYENVWGNSVIFRQVGTGYIRYSTFEGTTTWTNGNVSLSNVQSYTSTVNTTGSNGVISNSRINRLYGVAMQNMASLTITECDISNYGQISATGATRLYLLRCTITDGSRILMGAGSRIDASYANLSGYSYLQCNQSGGILFANYCTLTALSYIRNITPNLNLAERCNVTSQSNIRFDGSATNCRVYYSNVNGGATIYFNGTSSGCYAYYCTANSLSQISGTNSVNARIYYCNADARSFIRSLNCPSTHYMYYCDASASGYIQMNNATGRLYAVSSSSQSILEKRGLGGNIYYSSFDSYFYAYITRTGGTSSALFGKGRRTQTVTAPVNITPYAIGGAWLNF